MSRLIDADKLIDKLIDESIYEWVDGNGKIDISYVRALIYKQPTAYELDKVVEQLEDEKMWYETHGVNMDMKNGIIGATCKAIKIVKAGETDD